MEPEIQTGGSLNAIWGPKDLYAPQGVSVEPGCHMALVAFHICKQGKIFKFRGSVLISSAWCDGRRCVCAALGRCRASAALLRAPAEPRSWRGIWRQGALSSPPHRGTTTAVAGTRHGPGLAATTTQCSSLTPNSSQLYYYYYTIIKRVLLQCRSVKITPRTLYWWN